jgi:hypothetical protein
LSENDEYDKEEEEQEEDEERSVVQEITDYEDGKTTYLYDNGTYETVYHEAEQPSDCFVATACYGSALDQHVVFLRRFRDTEVMRTCIGKNFMRFFNALYYSFSPSLAFFLACYRIPKLVVRYTMVAPTIHLLRLSRYLAKPLSNVSPEASVVVTGIIFVLGYVLAAWALLLLTYHV